MAAQTTIRNLLVRLGVRTNKKEAAAFDKALGSVKKTMLAAAAAATAAGASLFAFAKTTANNAQKVLDLAGNIGIATDSVQGLMHAFSVAGLSAQDFERAFARVIERTEKARQGSSSLASAFTSIGVNIRELDGLKADDVFYRIAQGISETEDVSLRNAAAAKLLGVNLSRRLLPLLSQGEDGIKAFVQQAKEMGVVMSEDDLKASEEFNTSLAVLMSLLKGLRNQIGVGVIPQFTRVAGGIRTWYEANHQLIKQNLDIALDKVTVAIEKTWKWGKQLWEVIDNLAEAVGGWDTVLTTIASTVAVFAALKAWGMIIAAVKVIGVVIGALSIKVVAIVAILVGLVLVVQDLITYFRGGESVTGKLIERFKELDIIKQVSAWFREVTARAQDIWQTLTQALMPAINKAIGLFSAVGNAAKATFDLIWTVVTWAVGEITDIWLGFLTMLWEEAKDGFNAVSDVVTWFFDTVIRPLFDFLAPYVSEIVDSVVGAFTRGFNTIATIIDKVAGKIGKVLGQLTKARKAASKIPGMGFIGGREAAQEEAQQNRARAQQNVAMASNIGDTEITVNAETNASADEIASAVASKQDDSYQRRMRQARAAFGGGEL